MMAQFVGKGAREVEWFLDIYLIADILPKSRQAERLS
jgi:hypothetical protein